MAGRRSPWRRPTAPGAIVATLDLRTHEAVVEHTHRDPQRVPLTPDRPVSDVTRELLTAVAELAGPVEINPTPQEVSWSVPWTRTPSTLATTRDAVERYFAAATQAALVLAAFRAPYRGRSTPVNAWWGSFDLAVNLFSGAPADPPSAGLHHAKRNGRRGGGDRLVAWGRTL